MNTLSPRESQAAFEPHQPEIDALDLVQYWRAIARNWWRIAALAILVGLIATLYAYSLTPIYRASATLLVEGSRPRNPALAMEELYVAYSGTTRDYFLTQFEIIKSRDFAQRLVRSMGLVKHPEFDPRQAPKPWYSLSKAASPEAVTDAQLEDGVVDAVMGRTSLQPVRNTQLVRVSFDAVDPELAAKVPNELAKIYILADLESRIDSTRKSTEFLTQQVQTLKDKLAQSERALQEFREREKIVEAKGVSLAGASRQLEELSSALIDARRKRADLEAAYEQITTASKQSKSGEGLESLPIILRNPVVQRAKDNEVEAERRLGDASKRYGPDHPRMVAAQADIKAAQENLRRQIAVVAQSVAKDYELAKANEGAIERALARAKSDIQSYNRREFELQALERDVAANRQLYDSFMQRSREAKAGEMQMPIARVIDEARRPGTPIGPNKRGIVSTAVFVALLVGAALALLIERVNNTVKASHEVESKLGARALGVLPITAVNRDAPVERMFTESNMSAFSEAIRTIRSSVLLTGLNSKHKVVLLTSSVPEEGKTTLALNLAFAFAQVKKTVLVEADMRRPRFSRILEQDRHRPGLSEMVGEGRSPAECIFQVPDSTLHVLQAGRVPSNPLELISSRGMEAAIERLKEDYEIVLVDSPPVQLVSDAVMLSQLASSVIFVVRAESTPYPVARHALNRLNRAGAPLLGVVLNQIDLERADSFYGEYSGYGNRYYRKYGYYGKSQATR